MSKKKILLVEDEKTIAEMYKLQFELAGYEVLLATDGYECIIKAVKEKPDLIILDVVIPKLDGLQTLKQLRNADETKDIKICILSNLDNAPDVKKGLTAGADFYFPKSAYTPGEIVLQLNHLA